MDKRQFDNSTETQKGCIGIVVVCIFIAISIYTCSDSSDEQKESQSTPRQETEKSKIESPSTYVTKDGFIAAISEEYLDEAYMYVRDNDSEALDKLIKMQVVFLLKPNIEVIIVDGTLLGKRKAEFRIKGDRNTFWTIRDAFSILTEEEYDQLKLKSPKE